MVDLVLIYLKGSCTADVSESFGCEILDPLGIWPTITRYWAYFRNTLAAWVFKLGMQGGGSMAWWTGLLGALAVLLFFGKMARMWVDWRILLPELWRMAAPIAGDLARLVRRKLGAAISDQRRDKTGIRIGLGSATKKSGLNRTTPN